MQTAVWFPHRALNPWVINHNLRHGECMQYMPCTTHEGLRGAERGCAHRLQVALREPRALEERHSVRAGNAAVLVCGEAGW